MATWKSAAYDGRYLQLDISESVNVVGNSSTLSWTLTSTGGASTYYTIDTTTVTINGTTVYSKGRTYWDDRVFPAKKGSVSGTITVAHDSNGSKTIAVGFSTRVYIYGSQEYGGSMTLTTIDRSAPTVTFSTSNVTANGFKISATSSATADIWQYSTNGGSSWTQFSTTASTSASVTLSSLSPNTSYTVRVRARRQYNHVYGTSGSSTVKTLGGAVVNSVNTVTADNATVSITINVTVYEASYTNTLVLKNSSTSILTISGLSWSKGTANRTVTLTSAQRTTLLNAMASIKSFTGTFAVSSYSGSTQIGSTYYNGKAIPGWVKKLRWYVVEVSGDRTVINKDESGRYAIMSPVKTSALAVAGTKPSEDYRIHTVVHGDTLWAIAKKYLGNGNRYKEIVSLNGLKSNVIYSGMKLKIPNK